MLKVYREHAEETDRQAMRHEDLVNQLLGAVLRSWRTAAGLSLDAFALQLGCTPRVLGDYERARVRLPALLWIRAQEILPTLTDIWVLANEPDSVRWPLASEIETEADLDRMRRLIEGYCLRPDPEAEFRRELDVKPAVCALLKQLREGREPTLIEMRD